MDFLRGRINRATYWLALGLVILGAVILNVVFHQRTLLIEGIFVIICVPRLQDIGRPGWWALGPFLFVAVNVIAGIILLTPKSFMVLNSGIELVIAAMLIWLGAIPGQPAANAFGEPPVPGVALKRKSKAS
jgi:uncharacterized membrane protein YhaH (DUF805 family)